MVAKVRGLLKFKKLKMSSLKIVVRFQNKLKDIVKGHGWSAVAQ